jgi:quinol monooxygenase YgiN
MMMTITAIIRAKHGKEDVVERALAAVAAAVAANEPETLAYHVGRSTAEPSLFTTFERFASAAAMERHNQSAAVAAFVAATADALAGPVELHACRELSAK